MGERTHDDAAVSTAAPMITLDVDEEEAEEAAETEDDWEVEGWCEWLGEPLCPTVLALAATAECRDTFVVLMLSVRDAPTPGYLYVAV